MPDAARPLLDALRARGDAAFLLLEDRVVSAAECLDAVRQAAAQIERGPVKLGAGDVVALRGRQALTQVVAPIAAWSLGLSTAWASPREPDERLPALLEAAGCRLLLRWDERGALDVTLPPRPGTAHVETSTLMWTSGSGGAPKVAVHGLAAHLAGARAAASFLDLGLEDTWLLSLPVHHVGGLAIVLRSLLSGACLAVPRAGTPTAAALERFAPTRVSLVSTQLQRLLADPAATSRLAACRTVLLGGGPVPRNQRERALDQGLPLAVGYGMTETSAFVAATTEPDLVRRAQCAGRLLPGRPVAVAQDGQIRVGGPTLFRGYLEGGRVRSALDADGLFATGDRGRLDEDGVLYVEGRMDRVFITGGENVQPEEIEAALESLEGVDAAVVVDTADAEFGRRPVAFVAGRDEAVRAQRLEVALRRCLPGFKVPKAFYRLPARDPEALKPSPARVAALLEEESDLERL